jgi:hypothetical protein
LTLSIKYFGWANIVLSIFVGEVSEYIQWFFSGVISLFAKLSMKGVIEEFVKEKFDVITSNFTIYCEDNPKEERPGKGITWDKRLFGSEYVGNRPCNVLTKDCEGKPLWIPHVGDNELIYDPFITGDRSILSKMNEGQIAFYNALNEEIRTFEKTHLERKSVFGPLPITNIRFHPDIVRTMGVLRKPGDIACLELTEPKPYSLEQINVYSRNKLERMAFYNQMASVFKNK